jgi:hypothetical protein
MAAIACVVMLLGAAVVAGRGDGEIDDEPAAQPRRRILPRAVLALLAVVATGAVAVLMAGALATRASHDAAVEGDLVAALEDFRTAQRLQPYAAPAAGARARGGERTGRRRQSGARGRRGGADQLAPVVRAGPDRRAPRRGRLRPVCTAPGAQPQPAIAARGQAMNDPRDVRLDLEPDAPNELVSLAERLERERPLPAAAFRGELRRRMLFDPAARSRPARLRLLIAGYAGAGSLLLLAGAASVAGVGPLGA